MSSKLIVLDTETTGLKIDEGHRLIEIGACVIESNYTPTEETFHCYINPERGVHPDAIKVHGLTYSFLCKYKKFHEIADDFLNFIKDYPLVIHNASFDIGFINMELKKIKKPLIKNHVIDTLSLFKKYNPGSQASLNAICKKYGISIKEREKHGALIDAQLLSKAFFYMQNDINKSSGLFKEEQKIDFEECSSNEQNEKSPKRDYKIANPSEQEMDMFLEMCNKLNIKFL